MQTHELGSFCDSLVLEIMKSYIDMSVDMVEIMKSYIATLQCRGPLAQ